MNADEIKKNLEKVREEISEAESHAGRKQGSVKLLAVSKFHPVQAVLDAVAAGQTIFGENRVQEACAKFTDVYEKFPETELHIIGTLQKNKAGHASKIASCIESADRLEIIQELEKQCEKTNKILEILFEYHTGEESKSGFTSFEELEKALLYCAEGRTPHLIPAGFMTMAPFTSDEKAIHTSFITLRETAEKLKKEFTSFNMDELSMGMSGDFRIAIEEGSTEVRIGTAIFGEREYTR